MKNYAAFAKRCYSFKLQILCFAKIYKGWIIKMDYKLIFAVLLTAHFLADFYFQSDKMAKYKDEDIKTMLCHGAVYFAAAIAPFALFFNMKNGWPYIFTVPILHFIVDLVKSKIQQYIKSKTILLFADQAFHMMTILLAAYFCATNANVAFSKPGDYIDKLYTGLNVGLPGEQLLRLACLFIFLGRPVNVITQKIYNKKNNTESNDLKAGRKIGLLERYLTVILILSAQYGTIGFVIAAKTATRYDKISKNKEFAEQYIIGTMISLLAAIAGAALYLHIP